MFVIGSQTNLASSNAPAGSSNHYISVNSAYQGYKGTGNDISNNLVSTNEAFNGAVTSYRFWYNPNATSYATLTQAGGLVGDLVTTDTSFQAQSALRLWETTDPNGNAFSSTQNFAANMGNFDQGGSGGINISNMTSGSIYFFYGAYRSTASLSATMTGSGTASPIQILQLHNGDFANNNEYYVARVDFTNEDGYTSVDYTVASGFNARWDGIVVTDTSVVPEPGAAALLGLGAFGLLVRRRR